MWSANHTPVYPVSDRAPHHAHRARWPCNRVRRRAHWLRRRTGPLWPVRPVGACPGRDRTAAAFRCQRRDPAGHRCPRRRAAGHRSRCSARSRESEAAVRRRRRRAAGGGRRTHRHHHLRRPGQPARLGRPGVRAAEGSRPRARDAHGGARVARPRLDPDRAGFPRRPTGRHRRRRAGARHGTRGSRTVRNVRDGDVDSAGSGPGSCRRR